MLIKVYKGKINSYKFENIFFSLFSAPSQGFLTVNRSEQSDPSLNENAQWTILFNTNEAASR